MVSTLFYQNHALNFLDLHAYTRHLGRAHGNTHQGQHDELDDLFFKIESRKKALIILYSSYFPQSTCIYDQTASYIAPL